MRYKSNIRSIEHRFDQARFDQAQFYQAPFYQAPFYQTEFDIPIEELLR